MNNRTLYSIGHGARKLNDFIGLLQRYEIAYLADVRSYPQSQFHPQFNRKSLERSLEAIGISYIFMGDQLGGRPKDTSCYINGRIDYSMVESKAFYAQGISRLKTAYEKDLSIAIMCSERNPCDCHRSRLIGKTLAKEGISLQHIDELGKLISQEAVLQKLKKPEGLF